MLLQLQWQGHLPKHEPTALAQRLLMKMGDVRAHDRDPVRGRGAPRARRALSPGLLTPAAG